LHPGNHKVRAFPTHKVGHTAAQLVKDDTAVPAIDCAPPTWSDPRRARRRAPRGKSEEEEMEGARMTHR
jgi:hypothetical protein